uniref:Portal protein n=1 Tax=Siphoviridae sp. ctoMB99 TaxID=2826459 RepID=A0A8S5MZI7_9CAUD|nr:MAG TPA: portal protein [Siphoviridae sp. ctoMB99]
MSNMATELRSVRYKSYQEIYDKMRELSDEYSNIPYDRLVSVFGGASEWGSALSANPYIQNRRVKAISTAPAGHTKDEVAEMLQTPEGNELGLRQVERALEYSAYPMFHTRKVYQDLLTYHSYITPNLPDDSAIGKDDFWREWKLLEKLKKTLDIKNVAHQIAGQALQSGKVFYTPRVSIDKSHNKINYAFIQQIPTDWTKIVGFNNKSKYTLAFNLFYFTQPGTDYRQFGDLFVPYIDEFSDFAESVRGVKAPSNYIFAAMDKVRKHSRNNAAPDAYYQNGRWYYWVVLPIDKVFTFEVDDANRTVAPPFTGLFIDMIQLAAYEAIQLQLVQNPLIAVLTGEIPYYDAKDMRLSDTYKLSPSGRDLFQAYWYQMLAESNTSGIGIFSAPFQNMQMHQLAEAPSAMNISSNGYAYTIAKAGLSGIVPANNDTRAGLAQISLQIESKFAAQVYGGIERMMSCMFESFNLKYEWEFRMFGDMASDKDKEEQAQKAMTLGILPAAIIYNALHDRSILDDIAWSTAIKKAGILDLRIPLTSSYSAQPNNGNGGESSNQKKETSQAEQIAAHEINKGGRPSSDGIASSDGQEADQDSIGE